VLGDVDKRIMGEVYKVAHENNISGDVMGKLTNAMMDSRQTENDAMLAQDGVDEQTSTRITKELWGSDYQTNVNMISSMVAKLPENVRDSFQNARLANGQALFNSPEMLSFFSTVARTLDPAGTVVPNSNNPTQSITDEIKALEARMSDDDWFADTKAQDRLRKLYTAEEGMKR